MIGELSNGAPLYDREDMSRAESHIPKNKAEAEEYRLAMDIAIGNFTVDQLSPGETSVQAIYTGRELFTSMHKTAPETVDGEEIEYFVRNGRKGRMRMIHGVGPTETSDMTFAIRQTESGLYEALTCFAGQPTEQPLPDSTWLRTEEEFNIAIDYWQGSEEKGLPGRALAYDCEKDLINQSIPGLGKVEYASWLKKRRKKVERMQKYYNSRDLTNGR